MPSQDPPHATLLAFDTSTEQLSLGVLTGGRCWVDNRPGGAAASTTLLPALHALLQQAGRRLSDVQAVAFGRGPGAFTGLRTSCAVAQGLAFGLGRPVLPIDSLLLVAEQARRQSAAGGDVDIGVVMDARMGQAYAARYRWSGGVWQVVQPPGLWAVDSLAAAWSTQPPATTAGSGLAVFDADLQRACPPAGRVELGGDRATALLALAASAWSAGAALDAADALPLYLRDKVAQTTEERAAARAALAG